MTGPAGTRAESSDTGTAKRWLSRRGVLRGLAATGAAPLAGCVGGADSGSSGADVIAGPDGQLAFEPAELVVGPGATVRWFFDSGGHNVSGRPQDSDVVRLPSGAEPFASYGPEESPRTLVPRGATFDHTFDVRGPYTYVCIPHVGAGMTGRIVVAD